MTPRTSHEDLHDNVASVVHALPAMTHSEFPKHLPRTLRP